MANAQSISQCHTHHPNYKLLHMAFGSLIFQSNYYPHRRLAELMGRIRRLRHPGSRTAGRQADGIAWSPSAHCWRRPAGVGWCPAVASAVARPAPGPGRRRPRLPPRGRQPRDQDLRNESRRPPTTGGKAPRNPVQQPVNVAAEGAEPPHLLNTAADSIFRTTPTCGTSCSKAMRGQPSTTRGTASPIVMDGQALIRLVRSRGLCWQG